MFEINLWNTFYSSGKVNDYLNYRRQTAENSNESEQGAVEVFDRRIDSKRN